MGIFSKKYSDGGLMNVIRCDEKEYLVWKWRPNNQELGESKRENSIRYGSSLRVKDGEMAVFVYSGSNGNNQDYIISEEICQGRVDLNREGKRCRKAKQKNQNIFKKSIDKSENC